MFPLWQSITNIETGAAVLRARRYGVIEMENGRFQAIHLRPYPKIATRWEVWLGERLRSRRAGNRCWIYYNQPQCATPFLSLVYVISSREGSLLSFYAGLRVLDEVARLKESAALLCEASNVRISARLLARWGWKRHVPQSRQRHFIKRFYGNFPDRLEIDANGNLQSTVARKSQLADLSLPHSNDTADERMLASGSSLMAANPNGR